MTLLELTSIEAKRFFLESKNYCSLDLPKYIDFSNLLKNISNELAENTYKSIMGKHGPDKYDDVNYLLYHSKNGEYDWRPFQIINPVMYVSLINIICEENNWNEILIRFKAIDRKSHVMCESIPTVDNNNEVLLNKKGTQITQWWSKVEQQSIELSLEYDYIFKTDIVDCYSSIYTHSISWALHTKKRSKNQKQYNELLGNKIDKHLQGMSYGQTNGIPQGSVLMDFIAEILLKYADELISNEIDKESLNDFKIIRYRDDYKIFAKNVIIGKKIMKIISKVLSDLGMKLNSNKTSYSDNVILESIKKDKIEYMKIKNTNNIQKKLLLILEFSLKYPNSGSLKKELSHIRRKIENMKKFKNYRIESIISIITEIIYKNPSSYIEGSAILSYLLPNIEVDYRNKIIEKIFLKLDKILNSGYFEIWFQRAIINYGIDKIDFNENICKLVLEEKDIKLWNMDWITNKKIKKILDTVKIIDETIKNDIPNKISNEEIKVFDYENNNY